MRIPAINDGGFSATRNRGPKETSRQAAGAIPAASINYMLTSGSMLAVPENDVISRLPGARIEPCPARKQCRSPSAEACGTARQTAPR
jgi:hypothetical protein